MVPHALVCRQHAFQVFAQTFVLLLRQFFPHAVDGAVHPFHARVEEGDLGPVKLFLFLALLIQPRAAQDLFAQAFPAELQADAGIAAKMMDLAQSVIDAVFLEGAQPRGQVPVFMPAQLAEFLQDAVKISAHAVFGLHDRRKRAQHGRVILTPPAVTVKNRRSG